MPQPPMPGLPIERSIAHPSLLADILVSKYADHQPLYRQSVIAARDGVMLDPASMGRWVAALQAWQHRDANAVLARQTQYLELWKDALSGHPGITVVITPDPTNNPLNRLKVCVNPVEAKITAWNLADALGRGNSPVSVRDHEVEHGYFFLDPCNLHPSQEHIVVQRLQEELDRAQNSPATPTSLEHRRNRRIEALLRWPA